MAKNRAAVTKAYDARAEEKDLQKRGNLEKKKRDKWVGKQAFSGREGGAASVFKALTNTQGSRSKGGWEKRTGGWWGGRK